MTLVCNYLFKQHPIARVKMLSSREGCGPPNWIHSNSLVPILVMSSNYTSFSIHSTSPIRMRIPWVLKCHHHNLHFLLRSRRRLWPPWLRQRLKSSLGLPSTMKSSLSVSSSSLIFCEYLIQAKVCMDKKA